MSDSPESLHELPQPFDISSAVSLALRFNTPCSAVTSTLGGISHFRGHHHSHYHNNHQQISAGPANDCWYGHPARQRHQQPQQLQATVPTPPSAPTTPVARGELFPAGGSGSCFAVSPMATGEGHYRVDSLDSWSDSGTTLSAEDILESEAEQLDRFCKYIDSAGDDDIPEALISPLLQEQQQDQHLCQQVVHFRHHPHPHHHRHSQLPHKKKKRLSGAVAVAGYGGGRDDFPDEQLDDCRGSGFQLQQQTPRGPLETDGAAKVTWKVELANWDLWQAFDQIGTEMVITKNGRRMFPSLSYTVSKLQPDHSFSVRLSILPVDSRRYKFLQTEWVPVGRADKKSVYKEYVHPDSPNTGNYWMEKPITFKLVKLTNNKSTTYSDQMILNSMQKYQPVVRIICENDGTVQSFRFPETTFIAVTAYQNHSITQLKIKNNPYARAFRESIPSDGRTPERKGGHCKRSEGQQKQSKKSQTSKRSSCPIMIPPEVPPSPGTHSSTFSEDIGLNSPGHSSTPLLENEVHITECSQDMYDNHLHFWADDDPLYDSALLTPPMLSSSTFSEPYLQQQANIELEAAVNMDSPLGEQLNASFIVDVESVDDDVFQCS